MNCPITNLAFQFQSYPKQTSFRSNQDLLRANVIPSIDSTQCEAAGHFQSLSPPSSFMKDLKEPKIHDFLHLREERIKEITQISQQTESEKRRVLELRKLVFLKPLIQEAACIQNLLKNSHLALSKQILQELTSDAELLIPCFQKLQEFYQSKQSLLQPEKMEPISHMIESTWEQIYKLSVYDPALIHKVCQLEWIFRATEVLSHDRTDSLSPFIEYCEILKKAALTSESEEIRTSQLFERIENELNKYQSLLEMSKFLLLQNGNSDYLQKMEVQQVKELLLELKEFGFELNLVARKVEEDLNQAFNIEEKFSDLLKKKILVSANDLQEFLLQIQSFPVRLVKIQEHLTELYNGQKEQVQVVLQETAQRIGEKSAELTLRLFGNSEKSYTDFDALMMEAKEISRVCTQELERVTRYSQELMQNLQTFQFEDFCILSGRVTEKGYEDIRAELWLVKVRLLQIFCESLIKPFSPIPFEQICSFLPEIESYVHSLPGSKRALFDEQIGFLYRLLDEIEIWIEAEREKQEKTGKIILDKVFYGFIDVTQEIIRPDQQKRQPESPQEF